MILKCWHGKPLIIMIQLLLLREMNNAVIIMTMMFDTNYLYNIWYRPVVDRIKLHKL